MSFRPSVQPPIQDMPPKGGFPGLDLARRARNRGPTGLQIWAAASFGIAYGLYRVGKYNKERNGEKLEELKARYSMAPILQAEEDRWYMAREQEIMKKEAEIMKDVPGWKLGESQYSSSRWVPRQGGSLDKNLKK